MAKKVEAHAAGDGGASGVPDRTASAPDKIAHQRIDCEPKSARAARRRLKRHARRYADRFAKEGFFEARKNGLGVVRITAPEAVAAMRAAVERFLRGGCVPLVEALEAEAAMGFPSAAHRPRWAERCWLAVSLDRDGRIAFTTTWAAGDASTEAEREIVQAATEPRHRRWCETSGFGDDFETEGRA